MKDKIEAFNKQKEELIAELKEWVKDKSIPLEERWGVFVDSELGSHNTYYYDFQTLDNEQFHDGDIRQRYSQFNVQHVINWAESDWNKQPSTKEEIDSFKEEALNDFIYSWVFDW